ncbi:unnamed protein product [Ectocarpus sp. 6 AP-2014]
MASIRATKLLATIHKSFVCNTDAHFTDQNAALQKTYARGCNISFTDSGKYYTIHVQRKDGGKVYAAVMRRAIVDNYSAPRMYTRQEGTVIKTVGTMRKKGGYRQRVKKGVVVICAIGDEDCTLASISVEDLRNVVSGGDFYLNMMQFGLFLQDDTIRNHNFLVRAKESFASYVKPGHNYLSCGTKSMVCHYVFMNWVSKCSAMVDANDTKLDSEAVDTFRSNKSAYLQITSSGADDEYQASKKAEIKAVTVVSETAKRKRDAAGVSELVPQNTSEVN